MSRKPVKRAVKIADNFYSPIKMTVPKGSTVTWRWPEGTGDTHDVTLRKGPKGVGPEVRRGSRPPAGGRGGASISASRA